VVIYSALTTVIGSTRKARNAGTTLPDVVISRHSSACERQAAAGGLK